MDIRTKVISIISDKLGLEQPEVILEARLTTDLGADELLVIELIMEIEKEFNIVIAEEDAATFETGADIVSYLETRLV